MSTRLCLTASFVLAVFGSITIAQEKPQRDFQPKKLMTPCKAIVSAEFIDVKSVTDQVSDGELVIGVVVNGNARAYPINMLTGPSREIINDELACEQRLSLITHRTVAFLVKTRALPVRGCLADIR